MSAVFIGAWRVSEHVYAPDGTFLGLVRQRRELRTIAPGRVRVIQDCEPDGALALHPMGRFAGHHEFEVSVDGALRRYHGPAVVGSALGCGDGAMIGRGWWPVFGYHFGSFALVPEPTVQLTGGRFYRGSEIVAEIAGIAVPEGAAPAWPGFAGAQWPGEIAPRWLGRRRCVSPSGELLADVEIERDYTVEGWSERGPEAFAWSCAVERTPDFERFSARIQGFDAAGLGKSYGWMSRSELVAGAERIFEVMELFDATRGHLVGLARAFVDQVPGDVYVTMLRPLQR